MTTLHRVLRIVVRVVMLAAILAILLSEWRYWSTTPGLSVAEMLHGEWPVLVLLLGLAACALYPDGGNGE